MVLKRVGNESPHQYFGRKSVRNDSTRSIKGKEERLAAYDFFGRHIQEAIEAMTEDHDLLIRVDENVKELKILIGSTFKDHEGRIRLLENDINQAQGAIKLLKAVNGVIGAIAAILGALVAFR